MADFEENVEEMVRITREAVAVATEFGGDETATRPRTRPGMRPAVPRTRPAVTAGDETGATGGVMYTDEVKLKFDEDEIEALEGQRLVPDSGCLSWTSKVSMRMSRQEISVAETTVDRKRSPSRMMMKA